MTIPDVLEAAKPWMRQCGPHDFGVQAGSCGCPPDGDPRPIVSRLAGEVQRLRDADGLARDALRRSGYHFSADSDKPLAELIETLNADARRVVGACGEESKGLRDENERLWSMVGRVEDLASAARACGAALDPAEVLRALEGETP